MQLPRLVFGGTKEICWNRWLGRNERFWHDASSVEEGAMQIYCEESRAAFRTAELVREKD